MNHHPDYDFRIAQERYHDDLRRAEQSRLFKEAQAALRQNAGLENRASTVSLRWSLRPVMLALARSLSILADHMLNWSCRLQYRYTLLAADATEQRPSPCES